MVLFCMNDAHLSNAENRTLTMLSKLATFRRTIFVKGAHHILAKVEGEDVKESERDCFSYK